MIQSLKFNKYLYNVLSTNLKDIGIFPIIAEQGAKYPYIIFTRENVYTNTSKDGYHIDNVEFSVEIYTGNDYSKGVEIATQIRGLLDDWKSAEELSIIHTTLKSASEGYFEDTYQQRLEFRSLVR